MWSAHLTVAARQHDMLAGSFCCLQWPQRLQYSLTSSSVFVDSILSHRMNKSPEL